jgi:hypothetical protein
VLAEAGLVVAEVALMATRPAVVRQGAIETHRGDGDAGARAGLGILVVAAAERENGEAEGPGDAHRW